MDKALLKELGFELIGHAGVDSGTLVVVDPCYMIGFTEEQYDQIVCTDLVGQHLEAIFSGVGGNGTVFSTFEGDGNYAIYARFDTNLFGARRIAQVLVDMEGSYEDIPDSQEADGA